MAVFESSVGAPPVVPKKTSTGKKIALGCGGAAIVAALLAVVLTVVVKKATAGPEAVVKEFLAAAAAGDYAKAHSYFSAPLQQVQPLAQFQAAASARSSFFQVKDTTFSQRSIDTSGAQLSGSVTLTSGTQVPASFKLVRENGAWKLIGYNIGS
jgi:hypothetical protein